ncbi:helix-turn-helix transcriptional regulator [Mucilaginibacter sp.]|uniref:helix-turn-helix domain-containing protein n=1 Tax=Mucilaginibacter sp. TaxID=1882438 RepID=UPI00344C498A
MSDLNKLVGSKIKQKRLELGVTQSELGQILRCTQQMIQNYEVAYCAMPISILNDYTKLCKVPLDWFFEDE